MPKDKSKDQSPLKKLIQSFPKDTERDSIRNLLKDQTTNSSFQSLFNPESQTKLSPEEITTFFQTVKSQDKKIRITTCLLLLSILHDFTDISPIFLAQEANLLDPMILGLLNKKNGAHLLENWLANDSEKETKIKEISKVAATEGFLNIIQPLLTQHPEIKEEVFKTAINKAIRHYRTHIKRLAICKDFETNVATRLRHSLTPRKGTSSSSSSPTSPDSKTSRRISPVKTDSHLSLNNTDDFSNPCFPIIEYLLENFSIDETLKQIALKATFIKGYFQLTQLLTEHISTEIPADILPQILTQSEKETIIWDFRIVELLISLNDNVAIISDALTIATRIMLQKDPDNYNYVNVAKLLLEKEVTSEAKNEAFLNAVRIGSIDLINISLVKGADLHVNDDIAFTSTPNDEINQLLQDFSDGTKEPTLPLTPLSTAVSPPVTPKRSNKRLSFEGLPGKIIRGDHSVRSRSLPRLPHLQLPRDSSTVWPEITSPTSPSGAPFSPDETIVLNSPHTVCASKLVEPRSPSSSSSPPPKTSPGTATPLSPTHQRILRTLANRMGGNSSGRRSSSSSPSSDRSGISPSGLPRLIFPPDVPSLDDEDSSEPSVIFTVPKLEEETKEEVWQQLKNYLISDNLDGIIEYSNKLLEISTQENDGYLTMKELLLYGAKNGFLLLIEKTFELLETNQIIIDGINKEGLLRQASENALEKEKAKCEETKRQIEEELPQYIAQNNGREIENALKGLLSIAKKENNVPQTVRELLIEHSKEGNSFLVLELFKLLKANSIILDQATLNEALKASQQEYMKEKELPTTSSFGRISLNFGRSTSKEHLSIMRKLLRKGAFVRAKRSSTFNKTMGAVRQDSMEKLRQQVNSKGNNVDAKIKKLNNARFNPLFSTHRNSFFWGGWGKTASQKEIERNLLSQTQDKFYQVKRQNNISHLPQERLQNLENAYQHFLFRPRFCLARLFGCKTTYQKEIRKQITKLCSEFAHLTSKLTIT